MKKTKIVATISDRRCEVGFIRDLHEAGMDVVRINTAHVTLESAAQIVANVRAVSERIAILIDTKGPEMRLTSFTDELAAGIRVSPGDSVVIRGTKKQTASTRQVIYINEELDHNLFHIGARLLIDDGDIELEVTDITKKDLVCRVANEGTIKSRKSVNVPGVPMTLPPLSERDIEFVNWAVDTDIDFIAHSFVRNKHDVLALQKILNERKSHIKIISKIENQEGVDNIDSILDHTYGVMVARGDLGVEIAAEQIPAIQRTIVDKCLASKKPVIIATQMLHSMINNPRPTRAEVSDVAGAIYQRVDAIMLSGETANGNYPAESVKTMSKIAVEIEKHCAPIIDMNMVRINNEITAQLARSAVRACTNLPIQAIIIDSMSGRTGRYIAAFRGVKPVYAVCYRKNVMREMALSYGIEAIYQEPSVSHNSFLFSILNYLEETKALDRKDLVVVVGGSFGPVQGASFMEIGTVLNLEHKASLERRE